MPVAHYDLNEPWEFTAQFLVNNVLTDPSTVTSTVITPTTETTYTYPDIAHLTKDSVGTYRAKGIASEVGPWYVIITGTGTAAGISRFEFVVDPRLPQDYLNNDALVRHDQAEAWLDRQGVQLSEEGEDDQIIATLVNGASTAVQNEMDRKFRPLETGTAKKFRYDGSGYLSTAPYELRSVTSIVAYSDLPTASWWTLSAQTGVLESDYRLEPHAANTVGTYDYLTLPTIRPRNTSSADYEVTITGNWGVLTIPGDLQWLVLEICRLSYPEVLNVDATQDVGLTLTWLPRQLMEILDNYRRRSI